MTGPDLIRIINSKYPQATTEDWRLRDDGSGKVTLDFWNAEKMGSAPDFDNVVITEAEREAYEERCVLQLRCQAFRAEITVDAFQEAIFEKEEGRPEKWNALVAKRQAIKAKFPNKHL